MTNEEIKELAREYIDNCTERAGFVTVLRIAILFDDLGK